MNKKNHTNEQVVKKFIDRFGPRPFYYWAIDYQDAHSKISIGCRRCKKFFEISSNNHTKPERNGGCPHCKKSNNKWRSNRPAVVYLMHLKNTVSGFEFVKVGVCSDPARRLYFLKWQTGNVVKEVEPARLWPFNRFKIANGFEQSILKQFSARRIRADLTFSGSTECFPVELKECLLKEMEQRANGYEILSKE